jgi:hypothetical protein
MTTVSVLAGWLICVIVGLVGAIVLWKMADGTINLARLLSEPNGDASISRLQLLIFTFVIALSLFLIIVANCGPGKCPAFPIIPSGVLSLLGISASSYLVSKGIQFSDKDGIQDREPQVKISPVNPTIKLVGGTQQFTADTVRLSTTAVTWSVVAGSGQIDAQTGLYRATPGTAPAGTATPQYATIKAQSTEDASKFDLAVVTLI